MNNKGQSALEYLMTYGWALVVIVIVVAALFAFGVFNTPSNCTQFGGRLLLKDFAVKATGIDLSIQNGSTGAMTDVNASGLGTTANITTSLARSATATVSLTGTVQSGVPFDVNLTYTLNGIVHTEKTTCSGTV